MKSLSYEQLHFYSLYLTKILAMAQLQEIWTDGHIIVLELYKFKNYWLCFDLDPAEPKVVLLLKKPPVRKTPKPLTTFLNSKAKNMRLTEVQSVEDWGRVLCFVFQAQASAQLSVLQAILIPKSVNLIAQSDGKQVAWNKPKELPISKMLGNESEFLPEEKWESWAEKWGQDYWNFKFAKSKLSESSVSQSPVQASVKSDASDIRKALQKSRDKKMKALQVILEQLDSHPGERWRRLGECLKMSPIPLEEFKDMYEPLQSQSWNLQNAFAKAKEIERKRQGTLERVEILKREIAQLDSQISADDQEILKFGKVKHSKASALMKKTETQGRRKSFEGGIEAAIGKSAKDNINLLRSARAWDYWVHLRDYPSAHAIVFREKSQNVTDKILQEVSRWIIAESLSAKQIPPGTRYEVLVAECRFVKPIKGSPGLVNYQNEKVFTFASR